MHIECFYSNVKLPLLNEKQKLQTQKLDSKVHLLWLSELTICSVTFNDECVYNTRQSFFVLKLKGLEGRIAYIVFYNLDMCTWHTACNYAIIHK